MSTILGTDGGTTGAFVVVEVDNGSITTDKLADGSVSNAKLATMATKTYKGNTTDSPATPIDVPAATVAADIGAASTATATVAGSAATSMAVTGLDGDADGDYRIYFHILGASATGVPKLQINDLDTNLYTQWLEIAGASTTSGSRSTTTCALGASCGNGESASGWVLLRSRTGGPSAWRSGNAEVNSGAGPSGFFIGIIYTDNVTNITKLSIVGNTNSLDVGSFMTVTKLHNPS